MLIDYSYSSKSFFYQKYGKRLFDIFFAISLIIILSPLLLLVGFTLTTESGNNIIFKQLRMGQNKKEFFIYKFRTMVMNADKIGPTSTAINDKRITTIGATLRKYSIDELPQLFNVIKGDMSIVGYRPGVRDNYKDIEDERSFFSIKPGITGYAQINGRSNLNLEQVRFWEEKYIKEVSFFVDLLVIFKTIVVVATKKGVN